MPVRSASPPLAGLLDHHGTLPAGPPSASRQPPDGDEFPPRYHDAQLLATHPGLDASPKAAAPPLPLSSPPGPPGPPGGPDNRWRKDERSERSVRDKIAMFTTAAAAPSLSATVTRRLSNKFKSTEDVFHDAVDGAPIDPKLRSRSVVSVDRVGKSSSFSGDALLSSSSSSAYSSFESTLTEPSAVLPRKSGAILTRATSFNGQPRPAASTQAVGVGASDEARKASLIALVEQRRRSISKLRGLVIPDKVPEAVSSIVDLPEIMSKDAMLIASSRPQPYCDARQQLTAYSVPAAPTSTPVLSSPPWKSQGGHNGGANLPKYSPAFKRKSLTVRSSSAASALGGGGLLPSKPSRDLLIGEPAKTTPSTAFLSDSGRSAEEESDNDSAVSSSRSSISHGFSPPASPLLPSTGASSMNGRATVSAGSFLRRTTSDSTVPPSSTATSQMTSSGSCNSSCSSGSDRGRNGSHGFDNNRRVLKAQSVDAINRKNVLFSARCRSGCDLRTGSPLMQRDEEDEEEELPVRRRDPREEIKELERMVNMADTDVESNDALSCDDSVNSSDDTLEPSRPGRVHYRPATLRDLPAADVKVAFLNDTESAGIELDLHPVTLPQGKTGFDEPMEKSDNFLNEKVCNNRRKQFDTSKELSNSLSRKSSVDGLLNGTPSVDVGSPTSLSDASPRARTLKKRNASDPLFLERNGNTSLSPTGLQAVSVNDIRKAFEKAELALSPTSPSPPNGRVGFCASLNSVNERLNGSASSGSSTGGSGSLIPSHARCSSIDSTTSEDGFPGHLSKEQFGSITSLASTTSLISQQELQQLIDDANQTLEEASNNGSSSPGSSHEVLVVILHRETAGASVGITLAGGADYETKEITVHKVLSGSPAERDGRLQKGDRILSINGRNMKGVTHRESLAILKAPRPEVVLVVSRSRGDVSQKYEEPLTNNCRVNSRPPRILEQPISDDANASVPRGPPMNVVLQKDGAGLGFSLEGGKESPLGDRPLTVKKIFTGGCAEKSGGLQAGDELLSVNNTDVTKMSRIEAWGLMKRLPNGSVTLTVRHACVNVGASSN